MTSIDELFKHHGPGSSKRKFDGPSSRDASQAYKSVKLSKDADVKQASVSEANDDGDSEDEAGPALPPDLDNTNVAFGDEDEEDRFFGGGLEEGAKEAMDYLDEHDAAGPQYVEEKFDGAWVRRIALSFEKKITKNAELRSKYEDDPQKFVGSEADLDAEIKSLSILSEHSELYAEFAKVGAAESLVNLLAHENTDIAIDTIEIIAELTDEDVSAEQEQWDELVSTMLDADLLNLLASNFSRFDESLEADQSGVYHSLHVLENIASQPANSDRISKESTIFDWLLKRIIKREKPTTQNKLYASEILSILTQSSTLNRDLVILKDGIDLILQCLAPFRLTDPEKDSEEEEYMENLFNTLTCLVEANTGKLKFLEAEGVELCIFMLQDGKMSKPRALKVLDHACSYAEPSAHDEATPKRKTTQNGNASASDNRPEETPTAKVCTRLVDEAGLKPLFTTFIKTKTHTSSVTEHILGIFAALLRSLPYGSVPRLRLLAKFVEKEYSKIDRLIALRRDYAARVTAFNEQLNRQKRGLSKEEQEELELQSISDRLAHGLFGLQQVDVVLAWLVAEDDGAKQAIVKALAERDEGLGDVRETLKGMLDGVLEVERAEREMLETLVGFLAE